MSRDKELQATNKMPPAPQSIRNELDALSSRIAAGDQPSPDEIERFWQSVHEHYHDKPLTRNITEAIQLVEAVQDENSPLPPQEYASLVTTLTAAGDDKIALFAAMRKIAKK